MDDQIKPTYCSETLTQYDTDRELVFRVQVTYQSGHRPDFLDIIDEHFTPTPTDLPLLPYRDWGGFHEY